MMCSIMKVTEKWMNTIIIRSARLWLECVNQTENICQEKAKKKKTILTANCTNTDLFKHMNSYTRLLENRSLLMWRIYAWKLHLQLVYFGCNFETRLRLYRRVYPRLLDVVPKELEQCHWLDRKPLILASIVTMALVHCETWDRHKLIN